VKHICALIRDSLHPWALLIQLLCIFTHLYVVCKSLKSFIRFKRFIHVPCVPPRVCRARRAIGDADGVSVSCLFLIL
jgi:hypothetical protein